MSLASQAKDVTFDSIPIVDLGNLDKVALAREVRTACIEVGFFYVKNHGIPGQIVSNVTSSIARYFALPSETKMKLHHKTTPNFKGYSPLLDANIDPTNNGDNHEGYELGWEALTPPNGNSLDEKRLNDGEMSGANVWPSEADWGTPEEAKRFREDMLAYYHEAVRVGRHLFPLFALALELEERYFDDKTRNSAAIMRALHYPPQTGPVDDRTVGIGAHTDFEFFTILWQQPGIQALQVLNASKQWVDAPSIDGTLVINLGDQFARWTNDVFKSTVHRAINRTGAERYSIPLFFGTDYDVNIEPIESCVSSDRPPKYPPVTAGDYVKQRLRDMYHSEQ
ncbi:2OG-Fe(II) oxygenase [Coniophora puteana RWD-64-598 SS2]|uniref:2OG-Fe(II) oxygenase n=1 Tax=Coniophora puteana (strain RWD-64-598) TaxID=741705 RepID=A0A5M3MSA9_CONPW|nr:2OG-Fe(II) oxygenase [Coniophora puteana RWD-64-598 SS2]EIW81555.1 2OG-Fe(II) oxygenase [Coniophora puteana RWD-64-598 SS2]